MPVSFMLLSLPEVVSSSLAELLGGNRPKSFVSGIAGFTHVMLHTTPLTPLDKLRHFYAEKCPHRSLEHDLGNCLANGYLISTPEYLIAGKAVYRGAGENLIEDPAYVFDPDQWNLDTWYVFAYAGDYRNFFTALPYKMRFIAFHRRGVIRFYDFQTFFKRCSARTIPFSAIH